MTKQLTTLTLEEYDDPVQYDVDNRWAVDDEFYLTIAQTVGGPVLDAACGTGRLTRAIAEAGLSVVGTDLSLPMLDHARQKTPDLGIEWIHADCRKMQLNRQFKLLLMTSHAFQHMLTDADIMAFLQQAHAHLEVGDTLAFETRNFAGRTYVTSSERQLAHTATLDDGAKVDNWMWSKFDEATQCDHIFFESVNQQTGDTKREKTVLRYVAVDRLNSLLAEAGFAVTAQYGDWDRRPLSPACKEIITLCQKQ